MDFQIGDLVDIECKSIELDDGLMPQFGILRLNLDENNEVASFFRHNKEDVPEIQSIIVARIVQRSREQILGLLVAFKNGENQIWHVESQYLKLKSR